MTPLSHCQDRDCHPQPSSMPATSSGAVLHRTEHMTCEPETPQAHTSVTYCTGTSSVRNMMPPNKSKNLNQAHSLPSYTTVGRRPVCPATTALDHYRPCFAEKDGMGCTSFAIKKDVAWARGLNLWTDPACLQHPFSFARPVPRTQHRNRQISLPHPNHRRFHIPPRRSGHLLRRRLDSRLLAPAPGEEAPSYPRFSNFFFHFL
jgi:hypothetical protein